MSGDPSYPLIENLDYPIPLGKGGEKLASAFADLGWHWWPSYSSLNSNIGRQERVIRKGIFNSGPECYQDLLAARNKKWS